MSATSDLLLVASCFRDHIQLALQCVEADVLAHALDYAQVLGSDFKVDLAPTRKYFFCSDPAVECPVWNPELPRGFFDCHCLAIQNDHH